MNGEEVTFDKLERTINEDRGSARKGRRPRKRKEKKKIMKNLIIVTMMKVTESKEKKTCPD